jgi:hypothetical protein
MMVSSLVRILSSYERAMGQLYRSFATTLPRQSLLAPPVKWIGYWGVDPPSPVQSGITNFKHPSSGFLRFRAQEKPDSLLIHPYHRNFIRYGWPDSTRLPNDPAYQFV